MTHTHFPNPRRSPEQQIPQTVANGTTVEVQLPSRLGYEKVAMATAGSMAKLMGFREDRVEDLKTAVAEACINAIEHGNRWNEGLSVGMVLSAGAESLEVKVIDYGKGLRALPPKPNVDRKIRGEEDPRGMGMFLIQTLVDDVEWVAGAIGQVSYVKLVIWLDPSSHQKLLAETIDRAERTPNRLPTSLHPRPDISEDKENAQPELLNEGIKFRSSGVFTKHVLKQLAHRTLQNRKETRQ